jgi:hypothetical protein
MDVWIVSRFVVTQPSSHFTSCILPIILAVSYSDNIDSRAMRFRPLFIDYHGEAIQLERERQNLTLTQRPVIWVRPYENIIGGDNKTSNEDDSKCSIRNPSYEQDKSLQCENGDDCSGSHVGDDDEEDEEEVEATDTSLAYAKKHKDDFSAVFQPPRAYTQWMSNNSVSIINETFIPTHPHLTAHSRGPRDSSSSSASYTQEHREKHTIRDSSIQ